MALLTETEVCIEPEQHFTYKVRKLVRGKKIAVVRFSILFECRYLKTEKVYKNKIK